MTISAGRAPVAIAGAWPASSIARSWASDFPNIWGYSSTDEHGEIAALISGAQASPLWVPVDGPATAFDLALFRRGRWSTHIGIVIHHGFMIHMVADDCAKVQTYLDGPYKHRFQGHYRHVSKAAERPAQIISGVRR